jgi:hypothetical protein
MTTVRTRLGIVLSAIVAITAVTASVAAPTTAHAISCYQRVGDGRDFYPGPKSSNVYDTRFYNGPEVSPAVLSTHVPQGLATWKNYYQNGDDLLVYTAYNAADPNGRNAYVQGINPRTGLRTAIAQIAGAHVGGITVAGNWVYISGRGAGDGHHTVRKYRTSALRAGLEGRDDYVTQVGAARHVHGASFLSDYKGMLFAGRFNANGRETMYRYRINPRTGSLTTLAGAIEVPMKTQGLVVTKGKYIFSTSHGRDNRSNIYVTGKGRADLDDASPWCVRAPSMSEGATILDGRVYVLYEGGAAKYRSTARNPIKRLHWVGRDNIL